MIIQRKCISDTGIHGITPTSGFRWGIFTLFGIIRRSILRMSRIGEVHIVSVGCIQTHWGRPTQIINNIPIKVCVISNGQYFRSVFGRQHSIVIWISSCYIGIIRTFIHIQITRDSTVFISNRIIRISIYKLWKGAPCTIISICYVYIQVIRNIKLVFTVSHTHISSECLANRTFHNSLDIFEHSTYLIQESFVTSWHIQWMRLCDGSLDRYFQPVSIYSSSHILQSPLILCNAFSVAWPVIQITITTGQDFKFQFFGSIHHVVNTQVGPCHLRISTIIDHHFTGFGFNSFYNHHAVCSLWTVNGSGSSIFK